MLKTHQVHQIAWVAGNRKIKSLPSGHTSLCLRQGTMSSKFEKLFQTLAMIYTNMQDGS
jgi:hypothetical protein